MFILAFDGKTQNNYMKSLKYLKPVVKNFFCRK